MWPAGWGEAGECGVWGAAPRGQNSPNLQWVLAMRGGSSDWDPVPKQGRPPVLGQFWNLQESRGRVFWGSSHRRGRGNKGSWGRVGGRGGQRAGPGQQHTHRSRGRPQQAGHRGPRGPLRLGAAGRPSETGVPLSTKEGNKRTSEPGGREPRGTQWACPIFCSLECSQWGSRF